MKNRLDHHISALGEDFTATLKSTIERTRHARHGALPLDVGLALRHLQATGVRCHRALRKTIARDPLIGDLDIEAGERFDRALDWMDSLARDAGVRVAMEVKPLLRSGVLGMAAFERAYLLALLDMLGALEQENADSLVRALWKQDLPVLQVDVGKRQALTLVTARPPGGEQGHGMGIGIVHAARRRDLRASYTLLVPLTEGEGTVRQVCSLQFAALP